MYILRWYILDVVQNELLVSNLYKNFRAIVDIDYFV